MPEQLRLSAERFAVWARRNEVALPYPLEVTDVPVSDDNPATLTDPLLERFARISRAPRVSAFALRSQPSGATTTALAVAGADDAVFVAVGRDCVLLRRIRDTELATNVVSTLPERPGLLIAPVELTEQLWTGLIAELGSGGSERQLRARLHDAGVSGRLADVLLANPPGSVPIGTLAAMAWTSTGALGPSMASWHEYESGAVLTRLHRSRRSTTSTVRIGPYSREDALRAAIDAVSSALDQRAHSDRR